MQKPQKQDFSLKLTRVPGQVHRLIGGSLRVPDLQIAMRDLKIDRIRATRHFGAFTVLTLRAIEKIRPGA